MRKILKRLRGDRADSELISLIIVIPIVLGILFTTIDASIYFQNKTIVQSAAREAARSVAIYGGTGTRAAATPIELAYGQGRAIQCTSAIPYGGTTKTLATHPLTSGAYKSTTKNVECALMKNLALDNTLTSVTLTSVICTPEYTTSVGQPVECKVYWTYGSIPGSAMGFIPMAASNISKGTSNSEVKFGSADLRVRPASDN